MRTQSTTATDCRCKACGAPLAKRGRDGLTIRRGYMQVVVSGDSTAAVTCYRCRTLNVLSSRTPMPPAPASTLPRVGAALSQLRPHPHAQRARRKALRAQANR